MFGNKHWGWKLAGVLARAVGEGQGARGCVGGITQQAGESVAEQAHDDAELDVDHIVPRSPAVGETGRVIS